MTPTQRVRLYVPKQITRCLRPRSCGVILITCCRSRLTGRKGHAAYVNQLQQDVDIQSFVNKIWRDWLFLQALKCVHSLAWNANKLDWNDLHAFYRDPRLKGKGESGYGLVLTHPVMPFWPCPIKANATFYRRKKELKILRELPGKGSSETRNHPHVTKALPPPLSLPAAFGAPNSNLSPLHALSPRPRFIFAANKYFLNIPKFLHHRIYISALPHMAFWYPVPIWVSWQHWHPGSEAPKGQPLHQGTQVLIFLGEEEQAFQNSTNILLSSAHQCHCRRHNRAKLSVGPPYWATPFHCRSMAWKKLYIWISTLKSLGV